MKKSAVLYHYPCPDGAFAALAAHLYFSATSLPALFFPNTVYNPISIQQLPLHEIDDLYLLDFVGPSGFVQQISSKISRVVILDHHETALKMLGGGSEGETLLDADIWRWRLENSKAFSNGLKDLNIEFNVQLNPSLFKQLLSLDLEHIITQGMMSLSIKQKLINDTLDQSYEIALGGGAFGHCLAVNADSISELRSELGHQLATKSSDQNLRAIGAVVYRVPELENDQLLKVSLRSLPSEDTIPISQEFGGGGHRSASSFIISFAEFENWKVSKRA
ncbi:hypothetical protein MANES_02G220100v8 [Manihot esculenta]|uniref:Uncharacterized protein n=1 Tax=Manihot esculenta TaxID=3983 RepID=A0ACB7IAF6_MANES|nr:hypothetical protein MANES_02G220100v8 [Manihot esculenta]